MLYYTLEAINFSLLLIDNDSQYIAYFTYTTAGEVTIIILCSFSSWGKHDKVTIRWSVVCERSTTRVQTLLVVLKRLHTYSQHISLCRNYTAPQDIIIHTMQICNQSYSDKIYGIKHICVEILILSIEIHS